MDDLDGLAEMAAEEDSLQAEVDEQIASVESRLAALEEQRLFSGRYDSGDALVSVNAGAGGTDAQDWAEMVLRMEMRWAETSWLSGRAAGGERGRGSGHQVGHVPGVRRERLRAVRRRARRAPARSPVAVRLGPPPPDELRRGGGRAGREGHGRDRDRRGRPAGRHLPGLGRGRPARQQDRLGRADHPPADGHRRAVPERALAVLQPRDGDGDAAGEAAGARASANARRRSRARRARRRTSTSARRSAPTCCTRTRWSRTTARATRWATCSAFSTEIWMDSCVRTCSATASAGR